MDPRASGRRVLALVPPQLRRPELRRPFVAWGLIGLLVRVVLLPGGISSDTLAVYWRSHLIAFHGEVFEQYLVNMGSHGLHALWLRLAQPLIGPAEELWTHPWWWSDPHGLIPQHMAEFVARPDAMRIIALLKTPYVIADLLAGIVLLWLLWGRSRTRLEEREQRWHVRAWAFWMLSPAGLYAALVFGRYEAFAVLAVLVALLLAEREHAIAAALVLGVGMTLRTYPIVLAPVFGLVLYRQLWRQVGWTALAVAPFAASMLFNRLFGGGFGELAAVGEFHFGSNFFAFAIEPDRGPPGVYLFVAVVLAMGLYLLGRGLGWWGTAPVPVADLWRWVALMHLVLFAFTQFSAHYVTWLTPAIALIVGRTRAGGVVWLHVAQFGAVVLATAVLFGAVLYTGTLGGLGQTATWLLPQIPVLSESGARDLANIAWSVQVVALVAIGWPLLRATLRSDPGARPPDVVVSGSVA